MKRVRFWFKEIHLANWSLICRPKSKEGLGIINMKLMIIALIAKWYWKWFYTEPSLWRQLNCIMGVNLREWDIMNLISFWKLVKPAALPFERCIMFNLGREVNASFWHHDWGYKILRIIFNHLFTHCILQNILVKYFVTAQPLESLFLPNISSSAEQQLLLLKNNVLLSAFNRSQTQFDALIWNLTPYKNYSCKSLYTFLTDFPSPSDSIVNIWKLKVPPRILIFSWFMLKNKILTIDNLQKKGWTMINMCTLCRMNEELVPHLFDGCFFFRESLSFLFFYLWGSTTNCLQFHNWHNQYIRVSSQLIFQGWLRKQSY
jgi:zinc-binding in reverse transcriptase